MDFKRLENENERQYIWRTSKAVESGEMTWQEFADKVNEVWRADESEYRAESSYRKPLAAAKAYYEDVFSKMISNEYSDEIMSAKRELERAKIQFRDERNAWQKQNYADARIEQKLDYLEKVIKDIGKNKIGYTLFTEKDNNDSAMIVCLSDLHIGACYDSMWGKYDSDIAKERFANYLSNIVAIGKRHSITDVVVLGIGDLISGNIHKSVQVTNRENVVEQIILASDYISSFIGELCTMFNVTFINVSGNHSRIEKKDDSLKDERLDNLIGWYVSKSLQHLVNFTYISNKDTTFSEVEVCNNKYWVVHGDCDSFNRAGISKLVLANGYKPTGIFMGHLHTSAVDDIADIKLIRSGSFGGSGDDYTVQKRLTGKPSQTVVICNHDGIECIYPVLLK